MASKTERHALVVLGLTYRLAETVEQAPNKRIQALADRIKKNVGACRQKVWKSTLSSREETALDRRGEDLDIPKPADTPLITSTILALLSDLYDFRKRAAEKSALAPLLDDVQRVHNNYDRRLDRWEDYEAADRIVDDFYKKEA